MKWSERYIDEREPMEQKLCTQCANSRKVGGGIACHDKRNLVISLVDGRERCRFECEYLRRLGGDCGDDGKWFVPRDTIAAQDAARMNAGFGEALELTKKAVGK